MLPYTFTPLHRQGNTKNGRAALQQPARLKIAKTKTQNSFWENASHAQKPFGNAAPCTAHASKPALFASGPRRMPSCNAQPPSHA